MKYKINKLFNEIFIRSIINQDNLLLLFLSPTAFWTDQTQKISIYHKRSIFWPTWKISHAKKKLNVTLSKLLKRNANHIITSRIETSKNIFIRKKYFPNIRRVNIMYFILSDIRALRNSTTNEFFFLIFRRIKKKFMGCWIPQGPDVTQSCTWNI